MDRFRVAATQEGLTKIKTLLDNVDVIESFPCY